MQVPLLFRSHTTSARSSEEGSGAKDSAQAAVRATTTRTRAKIEGVRRDILASGMRVDDDATGT